MKAILSAIAAFFGALLNMKEAIGSAIGGFLGASFSLRSALGSRDGGRGPRRFVSIHARTKSIKASPKKPKASLCTTTESGYRTRGSLRPLVLRLRFGSGTGSHAEGITDRV